MSEYSIEFALQMATAANALLATSEKSEDRDRAILYISLVACEIALKSALEQSGISVKEIRSLSHNLSDLLAAVGECSILEEVSPGKTQRVPASRINGVVVDGNYANATIGHLLCGEDVGASRFPNQVRYGTVLNHFPAEVMSELANKVVSWVKMYGNDIQA